MQSKEAQKLRESWGGKACEHPDLSKEYYLSAATGDFICTTCGAAGFGRNWVRKEKEADKT